MEEDKEHGWWDAPAGTHWKCPECGETSPIEDWKECESFCDDCGSHDGRMCPKCDEVFDHVWGSEKILPGVMPRSSANAEGEECHSISGGE